MVNGEQGQPVFRPGERQGSRGGVVVGGTARTPVVISGGGGGSGPSIQTQSVERALAQQQAVETARKNAAAEQIDRDRQTRINEFRLEFNKNIRNVSNQNERLNLIKDLRTEIASANAEASARRVSEGVVDTATLNTTEGRFTITPDNAEAIISQVQVPPEVRPGVSSFSSGPSVADLPSPTDRFRGFISEQTGINIPTGQQAFNILTGEGRESTEQVTTSRVLQAPVDIIFGGGQIAGEGLFFAGEQAGLPTITGTTPEFTIPTRSTISTDQTGSIVFPETTSNLFSPQGAGQIAGFGLGLGGLAVVPGSVIAPGFIAGGSELLFNPNASLFQRGLGGLEAGLGAVIGGRAVRGFFGDITNIERTGTRQLIRQGDQTFVIEGPKIPPPRNFQFADVTPINLPGGGQVFIQAVRSGSVQPARLGRATSRFFDEGTTILSPPTGRIGGSISVANRLFSIGGQVSGRPGSTIRQIELIGSRGQRLDISDLSRLTPAQRRALQRGVFGEQTQVIPEGTQFFTGQTTTARLGRTSRPGGFQSSQQFNINFLEGGQVEISPRFSTQSFQTASRLNRVGTDAFGNQFFTGRTGLVDVTRTPRATAFQSVGELVRVRNPRTLSSDGFGSFIGGQPRLPTARQIALENSQVNSLTQNLIRSRNVLNSPATTQAQKNQALSFLQGDRATLQNILNQQVSRASSQAVTRTRNQILANRGTIGFTPVTASGVRQQSNLGGFLGPRTQQPVISQVFGTTPSLALGGQGVQVRQPQLQTGQAILGLEAIQRSQAQLRQLRLQQQIGIENLLRTGTATRTQLDTIQRQQLGQRLGLRSLQRQQLQQIARGGQSFKPSTTPRVTPPRLRPRIKIPAIPGGQDPVGLALTKLQQQGRLVDILVGLKKSKQKVLARGLPPFKALKRASSFVDRNIEASFSLIPSKVRQIKKDIAAFSLGNKFRPSKSNPLFVVEKKQFRLDSSKELSQIMGAKKKKKK